MVPLFSAPARLRPFDMQSADQTRKLLLRVTETWARTFNSGNPKDLAALYTESAYFSSPRSALLTGRNAIEQHFYALIKTGWKVTIRVHNAQALDTKVIIGVGEYTLTGSGRRQAEQILGNWGLAAVGSKAQIAMHISNSPAIRGEKRPADSFPPQHSATRFSSYERPY
jgi:uncharacterized protein (TIGR02246 family)